ncbi:MAG: hypothetical protein JNM27_22900 [Leptospirales bacterium]|nr:hypothetical protein [Leptospirales bacterium]
MELEIVGLNPVLNDMVSRGQLSAKKIARLVILKDMIDRYAGTLYVSEQDAEALRARYGAYPDIRSWGDYFQTELASQHFDRTDAEFDRIVDTVRFDIVSACKIFTGKPQQFLALVEENGMLALGMDRAKWQEAEEEAAHLDILRQYFVEMKLNTRAITAEDDAWFSGFAESAQAV